MTASTTANEAAFRTYLFQLPNYIQHSSRHTDYLTAEALNRLAQDIEQRLRQAIEGRELLPKLQPEPLTDLVISLLMEAVLQTKAATPPTPAPQLRNQLEAFYRLIKL